MTIGIVSDTHGYIDDRLLDFFNNVDEIWHAGDIGNIEVIKKLESIKPTKTVYGNIDDSTIRNQFPLNQIFNIDNCKILMTHIAGSFGKYNTRINALHQTQKDIKILVCGHSHILKVQYDEKYNWLYINPGAYGKHGFHKFRTAIKLQIENSIPKNIEVLELKR